MPKGERVRSIGIVVQTRAEAVAEPRRQLEELARGLGLEVLEDGAPDLVVVLGGDGTILRALRRFLGSGVPVIGVNYGRVGFLASVGPDELEAALQRVFRGEYRTYELPTLEATIGPKRHLAINDVVSTSGSLGRMIELGWSVGGEDLGVLPCDGLVCATPSGSTAYNLSSGGPVLAWGLDAVALTFVAPHSLHARPLVVPRSREIVVTNHTPGSVPVSVVADGHEIGRLEPGEHVTIRLGDDWSLLATHGDVTFFDRYRATFAS